MTEPVFDDEDQVMAKGYRFVVGIDEAGRGPLAGPVVAAAVLLKDRHFESRICDSKASTPRKRELAFVEIFNKAYVGIGIMNEAVIDRVNILQATYLAMNAAVVRLMDQLTYRPAQSAQDFCLLIDGNSFKSQLPVSFKTVIGGDKTVFSIACASIVAKVTRDRILQTYDQIYPQYGFSQHKGYGTKQHRSAIQEHGLSQIHRKTFTVKFP